ncbi:dTDP-4-dehydrorhamnose reductase [Flavobacterium sp.]|uniref:dTDP-4-dehydrorhamnose reductase n=1 Tax=Flavobacterium sp. TaxID=239 RepID=UPI00286AA08B|nr:dTDP-4-dehydrorhamnose reductase [Flavobacterium sp.]
MVVLVTGANGQLGQSIALVANNYPSIQFKFFDYKSLDITNKKKCQEVFAKIKPHYCINTAAYTAVDKAESESEKAQIINVDGAKNIAEVCKEHDTILLHISTDFVFDGSKTTPYTERDSPNPQSVYGQTKLDGEKAIQETLNNYFIIRTSWVYSQFGHNFMNTILRLSSERTSLSIVNDQIGTPTNAVDLAEAILKIITSNIQNPASNYGIYNFSNEGQCSWYDFAQKILEKHNININLHPIPTTSYPTPAQRPKYSVLNKSKIKTIFGIEIKTWEKSLETVVI